MGERPGQIAKRIGCAAIVAAGAVTLGLSVHQDVQFTAGVNTPNWIRISEFFMSQEECVYTTIRVELPEGASVYVGGDDWTQRQRLAELATLWAVPTSREASAQWTLALVPVPHDEDCGGYAVKVSRI